MIRDYTKAGEWLQKAAVQGEGIAQSYLGRMYAEGHGVKQDYAKAREWYFKAAANGEGVVNNKYNLGVLYAKSHGANLDWAQTGEWYLNAENAEDVKKLLAQYKYNLGLIQKCFEEAATEDNADVQDFLGWMYLLGEGVQQDYAKALEFFEKAAAKGHAQSQYALGLMYEHGRGVQQDYAKAREWYEKAVAGGHAQAKANLQFLLKTISGK